MTAAYPLATDIGGLAATQEPEHARISWVVASPYKQR